jgi:hypothetical protein
MGGELQSHAQVAEVGGALGCPEADRGPVIPDRQVGHAVSVHVHTNRDPQREVDGLRFVELNHLGG